MVSGKRDEFLDAVDLTVGMSTSTSTRAGFKAMSLVAMPKQKD